MSCCFRPPKEKYDFNDDQVASKNKKNKNKKNKAAKNGQAPPPQTKSEEVIEQPEDQTPEVAILVNGEPLNEEASDVEKDANEEKQNGDEDASGSADDSEENEKDKRNSKEPSELDVEDESTKRNSALSAKSDTSAKRNSAASAKSDDDKRTSVNEETNEDKTTDNNNDDKKGEVFVITLDKRNSFYGSVFQKQQDEKKREEEKKQKELEMKQKLAALKAANAPTIEVEDVKEKMDGDRPTEEPAPDYSDNEDDGKEEDYVELRKTVKNRVSAMLTRKEWDQILDKATLDEREGMEEEGQEEAVEIPEPDYEGAQQTRPLGRSHTFNMGMGPDGKKSTSPEAKVRHDLHREMMLNQKFGIDVLNKKSELQREFTKRKEKEKVKEKELPRQNSFETKLLEMKMKSEKPQGNGEKIDEETGQPDDSSQPEFMRVYSKIYKTKPASTSS